jgi:hypothetical protein
MTCLHAESLSVRPRQNPYKSVKIFLNILLKAQERVPSTFVVRARHSRGRFAMSNLVFGVPVRTRLSRKVWAVAAVITLFSLASSMIHSPASSGHAVYAGVTAEHEVARGS